MRMGTGVGVGLGLLLASGSATAGPPVPGHIDSEAAWVVHVDLEQMGASRLGSFMLEALGDETDDFAEIRALIPGFFPGPSGGMLGLTMSGRSLEQDGDRSPEDFCAIVYGTDAIGGWGERIEAIAEREGFAEHVTTREVHGGTVWSVPTEEGERAYAGRVQGRGGRIAWVIAFDDGLMDRAMARFADQGGGTDLLPLDGWREGTIAFAATNAMSTLPMDDKASRVIGEARSVKVRLGETDARAFVQMSLDTGDAERAQTVLSVAHGLIAIGQLASAEDPELARVMSVVQDVSLRTSDRSVLLDFSRDADELIGFIREAIEADISVERDVKVERKGDDGAAW
jgi:hypothetical protein